MKVADLLALYQFCADYHSGQWSRGYRFLCVVGSKLKRRHIGGDYLSKPYRRNANDKGNRLRGSLRNPS
jgi:hypothetical protein